MAVEHVVFAELGRDGSQQRQLKHFHVPEHRAAIPVAREVFRAQGASTLVPRGGDARGEQRVANGLLGGLVADDLDVGLFPERIPRGAMLGKCVVPSQPTQLVDQLAGGEGAFDDALFHVADQSAGLGEHQRLSLDVRGDRENGFDGRLGGSWLGGAVGSVALPDGGGRRDALLRLRGQQRHVHAGLVGAERVDARKLQAMLVAVGHLPRLEVLRAVVPHVPVDSHRQEDLPAGPVHVHRDPLHHERRVVQGGESLLSDTQPGPVMPVVDRRCEHPGPHVQRSRNAGCGERLAAGPHGQHRPIGPGQEVHQPVARTGIQPREIHAAEGVYAVVAQRAARAGGSVADGEDRREDLRMVEGERCVVNRPGHQVASGLRFRLGPVDPSGRPSEVYHGLSGRAILEGRCNRRYARHTKGDVL